ncbi:MAG: hydroxyacid dehydrogenase, partial [Lachnospiraceae bacterium]|nr:hydroxyacid dehydrogenase [Lachnospiraceae bacterium]
MKIVFLDRKTIGEDLDLSGYDRLGEVVMYDFSDPSEVPERVKAADIIVLNKTRIDESTIYTAEKLKLVCVTATGTNNLDKDYLARRGIE